MSARTSQRDRPTVTRGGRPGPPVAGLAALLIVLLVLAGLVGLKVASSGSQGDNNPVPAPIMAALTTVPAATFDAVGKGSATLLPSTATGAPLKGPDGKPEFLYVGAEYCPYCAAERWSLVVALSRFGSWNGVLLMTSAARDVYPSTPTFTFVHATYTSSYLSLVTVELTTNQPAGSGYQPLQALTPQQQQLLQLYDAPPFVPANTSGSIPFLDLGNRYVQAGSAFTPQVLHGQDWQQIAQALGQPSSADAQGIIGGANALSAAICAIDGNQPAAVCTSQGVQKVQLPAGA